MSISADHLQQAIAHHRAGRLAEAEAAYRRLLQADGAHADGLRLLGALYLQTGQAAQAIACLEQAARLLPGDAETITNLGLALRQAGRVEDALTQYRRALQVAPDWLPALNNLGALCQEIGRLAEAQTAFAHALRLAPESPAAAFNYGNVLLAAGRAMEAAGLYEQALKLKPDYVEAIINLGMALAQAGKDEQSKQWLGIARSWFDKALQTDPGNVAAMNNIGNVLRQQGDPAAAVDYYRQALKLCPGYMQAALNMATSLRDLGRLDEAVASCRHALQLAPDSAEARINLGSFLQHLARHEQAVEQFTAALAIKPESVDARWNKALSLLALGHYREGFALYECGLGVAHMRGDTYDPARRWQGEEFTGRRLLLWCEQGLGDSLQFIRYAAMCKARGGTVLVLCPPSLRRLFAGCAGIDALPDSVAVADFDLHAPLMSLPHIFGTTLETIPAAMPYLYASAAARGKWADRLAMPPGRKVGLVWAGNPRDNRLNEHLVDRRRSLSLEMLRPLFDVPDVQFYNLQMGAAAAQIDACGLRDRLIDPTGAVENFDDSAAIVERLDRVITVDTSVAHLAGGLGKPVWVLSRFDACWRWLQNRPDSPWYPTARIFGQPEPGDWTSVVEQVKEALSEKV